MGVEYNLLNTKSTNKENPRRNASIFSILSFWWLNNFLLTGSRRCLENEDLFPLLDEDKTKTSTEKLQQIWAELESEGRDTVKKRNGNRLFRALLRMLSWTDHFYIAGMVILRAIFKVLRPLFLSLLLLELMKGSVDEVYWLAYLYGAGICLSQFGDSLCLHQFMYNAALMSLRWKSGTIALIYQKVSCFAPHKAILVFLYRFCVEDFRPRCAFRIPRSGLQISDFNRSRWCIAASKSNIANRSILY